MNLLQTKNFELAYIEAGNKDSKKVAIVIPGRLDTKDYIHNVSLVRLLSEGGFYAISFDPPGTWESPGPIELYSTSNYLHAVDEIIELLGRRPTLVVGHSRGGTVAALTAARNPCVYAYIGIMPNLGQPTPPDAESIKRGWRESHRDLPPGSVKSAEQVVFQLPMSYFDDGRRFDVLNEIKDCQKPKLLFVSTRDVFEDLKEFKSKFELLATPKQLIELETEHDYRRDEDALKKINKEIKLFLEHTPIP